ncbi:MAG: TIGR03016 family PEP-CTERM system-associated outer membrane protein [Nitrospirota bacterium]|nr:TIGR03016 family PEP-CTERM system-associated outer membrane protein [Nitrospirota bacterium]
MKYFGRVVSGLALFVFALSVSSVQAELKLKPSVSVREEYNNNIYLTSSNKEDDFITTVNPALNLRYGSKILDVSLDYGLNFRLYSDHSEQNETSLRETQRIKLGATLSPYRDILFLKISDEYKRVPIESRRQVALDNYISNMSDLNHLIINPYAVIPLGSTVKLNAGYQYEDLSYRKREGDDARNHLFTAGISYELSPRVTTTATYNYLISRLQNTEDYDRQSAGIGMTWKITPRVTLGGNVGKTWFDYDNQGEFNSTTWDIKADYQVSPLFLLSAGYSRNFSVSANVGGYKAQTTNAGITYTGKVPISLSVYETTRRYNTESRKDKEKGVTLSTSMPITPRLQGNVTGNYSTSESEDATLAGNKEDVDRYSVTASLSYEFKITTVSLGYTWNWSDSNIDGNGYQNSIVWLQARFSF